MFPKKLKVSLWVKLLNVVLLKKNLRGEVVEVVTELKFVAKSSEINFKDELITIKVNIDKTFENTFLELEKKFTNLDKFQRLDEGSEDLRSESNLDLPDTSLRIISEEAVVTVAARKDTGKAGTSSTVSEVPAKEVKANSTSEATTNKDKAETTNEATNGDTTNGEEVKRSHKW